MGRTTQQNAVRDSESLSDNNKIMPNIWIQIHTFNRDLAWTDYHLQSFRKYCSGFAGVAIIVPTLDIDLFLPFEAKYSTPECPVLIRTFLEYPGKGFCHHMANICSADIFTPQASMILHVDPDCLWTKPTTPYDYLVDDKPVLLIEPFEAISRSANPGRCIWKGVVENALKYPVKYETMCRHPAVHHKWLYREVRDHIESRHQVPFTDYVLRGQNRFPHEFAEFPTLGAHAVQFHADKYHIIDRGFDGEKNDPNPHILQLWANHTEPHQDQNQVHIKKILG